MKTERCILVMRKTLGRRFVFGVNRKVYKHIFE
jgi:hypothetical protein